MPSKNWVPAKEAATRIGISYELLMSRIYAKKIPPSAVQKHGWAVFIRKSEVEKQRKARQNKPKK